MDDKDVIYDLDRQRRIGMPEAVLCDGKTAAQIQSAIDQALDGEGKILLTRLVESLAPSIDTELDYDATSQTAIAGKWEPPSGDPVVAVVAAGTSDLSVAREATRTLAFHGISARMYVDVGVAGLWRLLEIRDELAAFRVVIAVAGMEGALFSVLGGLVPGLIVAVPTSRGYGVAHQGQTALNSALTSCAQGIVTVNIDNGYGAACAVTRMLGAGPPAD